MTKMFVGGLPYSVDSEKLKQLFTEFGGVYSAQVIVDRYSNQSKGFGFVEMQSDEEAQSAIQKLNDSEVDGRRINVSVARPKEEQSGRDFNNRSGGNRNRY